MDILIVCGTPDAGGLDYAVGVVVGLLLSVGLCVHHRYVAERPATRQILPLK